jgi:GGDEF domain-containing protein
MNIDVLQSAKRIDSELEHVRKLVFDYQGTTPGITFSAGIASSDEMAGGVTVERLINKADQRLYLAKERGRDSVAYE